MTFRGKPRRELEVLRQRGGAPAAHGLERLPPDEHPVAAQLGGAVRPPPAALAREIHELLLLLGARQPRCCGVARMAGNLDRARVRVAAPRSHDTLQEVVADPRVGIDRADDLAARLRHRPGEHRTLRAPRSIRLAPDDPDPAVTFRRRGCDGTGRVVRPIVDDQHLVTQLPIGSDVRDPGERTNGGGDRSGLVPGRDDQRDERARRRSAIGSRLGHGAAHDLPAVPREPRDVGHRHENERLDRPRHDRGADGEPGDPGGGEQDQRGGDPSRHRPACGGVGVGGAASRPHPIGHGHAREGLAAHSGATSHTRPTA